MRASATATIIDEDAMLRAEKVRRSDDSRQALPMLPLLLVCGPSKPLAQRWHTWLKITQRAEKGLLRNLPIDLAFKLLPACKQAIESNREERRPY